MLVGLWFCLHALLHAVIGAQSAFAPHPICDVIATQYSPSPKETIMKLIYILLIALVALALHLAWIAILGPALAGGADGGVLRPAPGVSIAGSKPGVAGGTNQAIAGSKPGIASGANGVIAGAKPGIGSGA